MDSRFEKLFASSKKAALFESVSSLLEWDQETQMPPGGAFVRSQHIELIAGLAHQERISKEFGALLEEHIDLKSGKLKKDSYTFKEQALLREWRRDYLRASALPNDFVKAFAKLTAESVLIWTDARKENDFSKFRPYLEKIVSFSREKAEYLGYQHHPYDALLDEYEPGMTVQVLQPLFVEIRKHIAELLQALKASPPIDDSFLYGSFPTSKQLSFCKHILQAMGYDFKNGRLDLSTHPFSTALHPLDSRLTVRISKSLIEPISCALHEGGHSLYDMGLPVDTFGSPLSEPISHGIHESQSRFWETRIGQSKPFWACFFPRLQKQFKKELGAVDLTTFYRAVNKAAPSFIRVESDEVTYSLHVILRFEMEKGLIEGSLSVEDIPEAWNALMKDFLGISPPTDAEGCLQDIHWAMGGFGYFPSYALGNLYAAQMFEAFAADHPDWEARIRSGELTFIKEWLNMKVHQYGRLYRPAELIEFVTGRKLSAVPYIHYLKNKYLELYFSA